MSKVWLTPFIYCFQIALKSSDNFFRFQTYTRFTSISVYVVIPTEHETAERQYGISSANESTADAIGRA